MSEGRIVKIQKRKTAIVKEAFRGSGGTDPESIENLKIISVTGLAIRYLHHVVFEQPNTTPTIHNLLITFCLSIGVGEQWRVLARGRRAAAAFALSRSAYSRS
ncbi:hypothetical protein B0H13DRAFT_2499326 [Mycena leptocephala]|nr:hypothetical protein B0H13DRAFT_2499326 [Mycena leptocephala]